MTQPARSPAEAGTVRLAELTPGARVVLLELLHLGRSVAITCAELAELTGYHACSVKESVRSLVGAGLVARDGRTELAVMDAGRAAVSRPNQGCPQAPQPR